LESVKRLFEKPSVSSSPGRSALISLASRIVGLDRVALFGVGRANLAAEAVVVENVGITSSTTGIVSWVRMFVLENEVEEEV
jgi:hypothetical protein